MDEQKKVTTAGGVVINSEGNVLVVNQRGISWSLPKGYVEPGEDFLKAAKREIYEESGISDLEFIRELGTYTRYKLNRDGGDDLSEIKTIIMFLFRTNELDLKPQDPENPEARWVKREEVASLLTHAKDKEFFNSIISSL